ncbi:MAG: hypothetical protein MZU97_26865 [Bacillus subtilis]|nr:hypothetical protein [Bacillus subtilis]
MYIEHFEGFLQRLLRLVLILQKIMLFGLQMAEVVDKAVFELTVFT